jgi:hypothetical protein
LVGNTITISLLVVTGAVRLPQQVAWGPDVIVRDGDRCRDCRIVVTGEAELGDDDGPGMLSVSDVLARDSQGRFYVVDYAEPSSIKVFDAAGRFERSFGREGSGPAEFRLILGLHVLDGDTLVVFDGSSRRMTILDPEHRYVRSAPLAVRPYGAQFHLRLARERLLLNGVFPGASRFGHPFHEVSLDGTIARSFGQPSSPITFSNERTLLAREIAMVDGKLLAAFRQEFAVQEWNLWAQHVRTLRRRTRWFEPWEGPLGAVAPDEPPKPRVSAIRAHGRDQLWVVVSVPDRNWRSGLERRSRPDGVAYRVRSQIGYDTVIELWDLNAASVVAGTTIDDRVFYFVDDTHMTAPREDELGRVKHQVLHVRLSRF